MKIIIDIPDSEYLAIKNSEHYAFADFSSKECMMYAIRNGIPYEEKLTGKWIRVSERLPEDGQEILFSTKTGRVHSGKYHDDDSDNQWYSFKDQYRAWNNVVIAWQPLPEPYKEE